MTKQNLQGGFALGIIIAVIAVLAIGGGVYMASKNKEAKVETEDTLELETEFETEIETEPDSSSKGSLRSLLAIGRDTQCTFTSAHDGVSSNGTVFISASGDMRGDFNSTTAQGNVASHMITKDGYSYVWSGSQGMKVALAKTTEVDANTDSSVSMDDEVDYSCSAWSRDASKFALPSGVEFTDLEALLQGMPNMDEGVRSYNPRINF